MLAPKGLVAELKESCKDHSGSTHRTAGDQPLHELPYLTSSEQYTPIFKRLPARRKVLQPRLSPSAPCLSGERV